MIAITVAEAGANLLGRLLWHLRLAPLVWRRTAGTPKVLLYHACEPDESDFIRGRAVNTPPAAFAAQVEFLSRHYDIVGPDDLLDGAPPRSIVVTFDDGYESVARHAAPILETFGATGTVYLVTDVVDNAELVWVNELNWLLINHPGVTVPIAARCLGLSDDASPEELVSAAVRSYDRALFGTMFAEMWRECPIERDDLLGSLDLYLGWDEIERMRHRGWTFGSHTATHPDLRKVDRTDYEREIDRSIESVASRLGACTTFAYPFGFLDEDVAAHARTMTVSSIMEVSGNNRPFDPLGIARTEVTATSPAEIFAQIEVVAPLRAWAKRRLRRASPALPRHAA